MITALRWIAVAIVALGSGALGFASGYLAILLHGLLLIPICGLLGSGLEECRGTWNDGLRAVLFALCTAMAASLTLSAGHRLAPSHQRAATVVTLVVGLSYAVVLGRELHMPSAMWGAIIGGLLQALVLFKTSGTQNVA